MAQNLDVLLRPMANVFEFLSTPVHATLFPYPWVTTLHAARVSLFYQSVVRRGNQKLNWRTYCAGFLVMCWGGMFASHWLLSLPLPITYSVHPWINYLTVHLILTSIFSIFPDALNSVWLGNDALIPADGMLRTNAIIASLNHLSSTTIDRRLANSPFFHLFLGASTAAGGGIFATTLNVFSPTWSLSMPIFLRDEIGLWALLDIWGGALVSFVYGFTSGHSTWQFLATKNSKAFSQSDAKAIAGYVFVGLFAIRAWATKLAEKNKKADGKEKKTS